ncbi:MAG: hypothetical protein K0V04_29980 [Deltaproteobacteria bacterium]|nr:hypothetical protein [Deltaproteobacteria bacterium]
MQRRYRADAPPSGLTLLVGVSLIATAGCTLILDPQRRDDIIRCDFDDDCPAMEDPRYELFCTVSEEYQDQDLDFSRICAPRTAVSCDPREYAFDSVIAVRYREATGQVNRYAEHCTTQPGTQGCVAGDGACEQGLSPHEVSQRCDDLDLQTPPAVAAEPQVSGQDVLDQFCRAVYCDIQFACRARDFRCVPCKLGNGLGAGGCGDLYFDGERSSAYQSASELESECEGPQIDVANAYIGPVVSDDGLRE